jgi:hypothetical protein
LPLAPAADSATLTAFLSLLFAIFAAISRFAMPVAIANLSRHAIAITPFSSPRHYLHISYAISFIFFITRFSLLPFFIFIISLIAALTPLLSLRRILRLLRLMPSPFSSFRLRFFAFSFH